MNTSSRVRIPADVLVRVINGESFILNVQTQCYFGLDPVGARIFEVLGRANSIDDAFDRVQSEYDVHPDILRRDFDRLVAELVQQRLLEPYAASET